MRQHLSNTGAWNDQCHGCMLEAAPHPGIAHGGGGHSCAGLQALSDRLALQPLPVCGTAQKACSSNAPGRSLGSEPKPGDDGGAVLGVVALHGSSCMWSSLERHDTAALAGLAAGALLPPAAAHQSPWKLLKSAALATAGRCAPAMFDFCAPALTELLHTAPCIVEPKTSVQRALKRGLCALRTNDDDAKVQSCHSSWRLMQAGTWVAAGRSPAAKAQAAGQSLLDRSAWAPAGQGFLHLATSQLTVHDQDQLLSLPLVHLQVWQQPCAHLNHGNTSAGNGYVTIADL